ncbi:endospore germination permease [Lutibacter sp. B2]|nr:endospore germination permease [Lutibacter sp. B2]
MNKEVISDKQGIFIIVMFIMGTSTMLVTGLEAKKDLWLADILAIIMAVPVLGIYARLHYIFPNKDLFDMLVLCFGKFIGKGIGILYVWFTLHLSSLILMNIGDFITISALSETPKEVVKLFTSILAIWIVKEGIEVMSRWSDFFLPFMVVGIVLTILLLMTKIELNNIKPLLYEGMSPVFKGAFEAFSFPFAETVVFTMAFCKFRRKNSPYKIYLLGLFVGGILILSISTIDILVLGVNNASSLYFPSYSTVSKIDIGDFVQRLEIIAAVMFMLGAFLKFSICLMATTKGITKVLGYKGYRFMVIPIALIILSLASIVHDNIMDLIEWDQSIWPYYAFLFQVVFPMLIFIVAEFKRKYGKLKT